MPSLQPQPHARSVEGRLAALFSQAATRAFEGIENIDGFDPVIRDSKFADYQANGALGLAKKLGRPPREVAQELVDALPEEASTILAAAEVTGPGFLNCRISDEFLSSLLGDLAVDETLGVERRSDPQTYLIDYSHPNIAKTMHVGHLRTTVIGDALARMLEARGDVVLRQNHVGDWGTQFGMLIQYLDEIDESHRESLFEATVSDLDALYRLAYAKFREDDDFKERARLRVVSLQSGDPATLAVWHRLVEVSKQYFERVYERMDITLTPDDYRGESFYNDQLDDVVAELEEKGLLRLDDDAMCAFPAGFNGRDGEPLPMIVRKSDGGYGYAATDLAALRYRTQTLHGKHLLYVIDARQSLHLNMVYAVGREAGWLTDDVEIVHVQFGTVLGKDGKPFKTRSGETVQLASLLDEAVERAAEAISERALDCTAEERAAIARAVGIGAVKWGDLSGHRAQNYVFDWERMLSFSGDSGPYVQYAVTRARSVLRKAEAEGFKPTEPVVAHEKEHELALRLAELGATVERVLTNYEPHLLATYLLDLADRFTAFYDACPVLRGTDDQVRNSRLALCKLTADVLEKGLYLLGITAPERM